MKIAGAVRSLLQGVSQQPDYERGLGQHTEQVNMIPDPVRGLVRRRGSKMLDEVELAGTDYAAMVTDTNTWGVHRHIYGDDQYDIFYPKTATTSTLPVLAFNRTSGQWCTLVDKSPVSTDSFAEHVETGVTAITSVGKFVLLATNHRNAAYAGTISGALGSTATTDKPFIAQVKSGEYETTYTLNLFNGTTAVNVSYTTPSAAYPGVLDLSSVSLYIADPAGGTESVTESAYFEADGALARYQLSRYAFSPSSLTVAGWTNSYPATPVGNQFYWDSSNPRYIYVPLVWATPGYGVFYLTYTANKTMANPDYSASVNKITNDYASAQNEWIKSSAEQTTPTYIATQLKNAAVSAGWPHSITQQGGALTGNSVVSGSLKSTGAPENLAFVAVGTELDSVGKLPTIFSHPGVKIKPGDGTAFYMQGSYTAGSTVWTETTSVGARYTNPFSGISFVGNDMHVIGQNAALSGVTGPLADFPVYLDTRTAGDDDTNPSPYFVGRRIDYLGLFQGRLLVGTSGTINVSASEDYFSFYRTTVLTIPASDPFRVASLGNESDGIKAAAVYDKSLVLFGERRQYALNGDIALTTTSAAMPVFSSYEGATTPIENGSYLWYTQATENGPALFSLQPSEQSGKATVYKESHAIDSYIGGEIIDIVGSTEPTWLFLRSTARRNNVFILTYKEEGRKRVQAAWHRWEFNDDLGVIIGCTPTKDGLTVYSIRQGDGGSVWAVADRVPFDTTVRTQPYLDSWRPWASVDAGTGWLTETSEGDYFTVFSTGVRRLIGAPLGESDDLFDEFPDGTGPISGAGCYGQFTPTSFLYGDPNDKTVVYTNGVLVVTTATLSLADSSGFITEITRRGFGTKTKTYTARVVGAPDNLIGSEPVRSYQETIAIGLDTRDYTLTFKTRSWMPFNLTDLQWVGQKYNRTPRN